MEILGELANVCGALTERDLSLVLPLVQWLAQRLHAKRRVYRTTSDATRRKWLVAELRLALDGMSG